MAMTKKQKLFVEEYLIDLNATQAAIRAGYSTNTAYLIGDENLKKPEIKSSIEKALAERSKRTGVNGDRIITELAKIVFLNPSNVINLQNAYVLDTADEEDLACIYSDTGDSIEREIKTYDKIKVEGVIPVVIQDDLGEDDDDYIIVISFNKLKIVLICDILNINTI